MRHLNGGKIALLAGLMIAMTCGARAQGKFGIGVIVGEPTGVAWKYRLTDANAIDGALGFAPDDRTRFHIDYLWEKRSFQEQHLLLHYGAGAAFGIGGPQYVTFAGGDSYFLRARELGFALRGVVGLTYEIPRSPLDAFIELAPLFILSPVSGMGIDAGIGLRVYP